jgi:hypothetical protein
MMDDYRSKYDTAETRGKQLIINKLGSSFVSWVAGIGAVFITGALINLSNTISELKTTVAVMVAKPPGVPQEEYLRDLSRHERDLQDFRERLYRLEQERQRKQ